MTDLNIADLLRYVEGVASNDEAQKVYQWIEKEQSATKYIANYLKVSDAAARMKDYCQKDIQYVKIKDQMSQSKPDDVTWLKYLDKRLSRSQALSIDQYIDDNPQWFEMARRHNKLLSAARSSNNFIRWNTEGLWHEKNLTTTGDVRESVSDYDRSDNRPPADEKTRSYWKYILLFLLPLLAVAGWWIKNKWTEIPEDIPLTEINDTEISSSLNYDEVTIDHETDLSQPLMITRPTEISIISNPTDERNINIQDEFLITVPRNTSTKIRIVNIDDKGKEIEVQEGHLVLTALNEEGKNITMNSGEKLTWNQNTLNLEETGRAENKEHIDASKLKKGETYTMLQILDHLMEYSDWNIVTSPNMSFDPEAEVRINLEQSIDEILNDLEQQIDIDYVPLSCTGCYRINRMTVSGSNTLE